MSRPKEILARKKEVKEVQKRAKDVTYERGYYDVVTDSVAESANVSEEDTKKVLVHFFEYIYEMTDQGSADPENECIFVPGFGVFYPRRTYHTKDRTTEWRIAFIDEKSYYEEHKLTKGDK